MGIPAPARELVVVPRGLIQPGDTPIPVTQLDPGNLSVTVAVERAAWLDEQITISCTLERSWDGVRWEPAGAFSANGGIAKLPNGDTALNSYIGFTLPDRGAAPLIRGSLRVARGSVITQCAVRTEPHTPVSAPIHNSIAFVSIDSVVGGAVNSITTPGFATTTGFAIALGLVFYGGLATTLTGFTDMTFGNTFNVNSLGTISGGNNRAAGSSNTNITGGANHQFNAAFNNSLAFPTLFALQFSGQDTSGLDQLAALADTTTVTTHDSALTGTTAQANELLVGWGGETEDVTMNLTIAGGWDSRANISNGGAKTIVGTRNVTATGQYQFQCTSDDATTMAGQIMTFKEAGGAPTTTLSVPVVNPPIAAVGLTGGIVLRHAFA